LGGYLGTGNGQQESRARQGGEGTGTEILQRHAGSVSHSRDFTEPVSPARTYPGAGSLRRCRRKIFHGATWTGKSFIPVGEKRNPAGAMLRGERTGETIKAPWRAPSTRPFRPG